VFKETYMAKRTFLLVLCMVALGLGLMMDQGAGAQDAKSKRRVIKATGSAANLPFSEGVLVDKTLYVAGHIGLDPKTGKAPADVDQEIKLLLESFQATLKEGGMTMEDLVSVQVYCTDLSLYEKFNAAYATYFKKEFPARMFVGAGSLLRDGHFEMMGVAVKR
jgi:2-iminobutanoate/2-iminopropanoate deaminase